MALKILLADDSMTAQNMGKKILLDAGYEVVAVSNGAAAIKKITSDRPDIIILDVYMPGYTGLEVCERVKAANETAKIPVLLTVGKMEPFKPEDANRVKADGVMVKPFEASDLIAVVQNFGRPGGAQTIPKPHDKGAGYIDTVPIPTPPERVHEDTVRLTADQLRAFQDESFKQWKSPSATASTVSEMSVTAPVLEDTDVVIKPSPISYGHRDETEEKEKVEPFVASSVLEALVKEEAGLPSAVTTQPVVTPEPVPAVAESAPIAIEIPPAIEPVVAAETSSQPFFTVSPSEPAVLPEIEFAPPTPAFVEAIKPELEASTPVADVPAFMGQLQDFEPNLAPPINIVAEAAAELEINSPPELRNQPVIIERDPALVTDPDDLASFTTSFGAAKADDVKVGLISELPEEQQAALTQSSSLPQEVTNEIASVLGLSSVPSVLNGSNAAGYVLDELDNSAAPETPAEASEPISAYVPGIEETHQFSPLIEQPAQPPTPTSQLVELASLELEPQLVVQEPVPTTGPEPAAIEPEIALSAAAGTGATEVTSSFHSVLAEPQPSLSTEETATFIAGDPQATPVEDTLGQRFSDPQLAEQLAAALATKVADETAAEAPIIAAEPVPETKDPGATDIRLSEAVAKAFERLKPQIITEILKELRK